MVGPNVREKNENEIKNKTKSRVKEQVSFIFGHFVFEEIPIPPFLQFVFFKFQNT